MFAILFFAAVTACAIAAGGGGDADLTSPSGDGGSIGRVGTAVDAGRRFGGGEAGNGASYDGARLAGVLKDGFRRPKRECTKSGCHKGYCWSYCSIGAQWCYTTTSYSQSFRYEPCTNDSQCSCWWSCAGSCTV